MSKKDGIGQEERRNSSARKSKAVLLANKRRSRINGFLYAFKEVSNIINTAFSSDDDNKKEQLIRLYSAQRKVTNIFLGEWNLSREDSADTYVISNISGLIGSIIQKNDAAQDYSSEVIAEIAKKITKNTTSSEGLTSLIIENMISSDVIVNVKAALLIPAMRMSTMLYQLRIDEASEREHLMWLHKTSVILAKDLAFNWDKESLFKDREALFQTVLPQCSMMVFDIWKDAICSIIKNKSVIGRDNVFDFMPMLSKEISNLDMGYASHEEFNMEWLLNRISDDVWSSVSGISISNLNDSKNNNIQAMIVASLDYEYAETWKRNATKEIDDVSELISKMSEDEIDDWEENEGSKPMNIDCFIGELQRKIDEKKSLILISKVDLKILEDEAKKRLALLWGLSDAVFKLKGK